MKKLIISKSNIDIKSYAKLNLNIKIGDFDEKIGLHRITSELIAINFFETLIFSIELYKGQIGAELEINPQEQNCSTSGENSVYKAAKLWAEQRELGVKIYLRHDDNVPSKKGLGIASSNAGCTLLLLERLAELAGLEPLSLQELAALSLKVGSDVPFFTLGENHAIIRGFGEIVEPIKDASNQKFLLHIPPHCASTKNAFLSLYKNAKKCYDNFQSIDENRHYYEFLKNKTGSDEWILTGSGSAFFIKNPSEFIIEQSQSWTNLPTRLFENIAYNDVVLV